MNRIVRQIIKSYQQLESRRDRGWERIYFAIDIHDTIMPSTYSTELSKDYYPFSVETLKLISERDDTKSILWTASHEKDCDIYLENFKSEGITFEFVNKNPEAENTPYGNYKDKLYANVILDDKSGFNPGDWFDLYLFFNWLKTDKNAYSTILKMKI